MRVIASPWSCERTKPRATDDAGPGTSEPATLWQFSTVALQVLVEPATRARSSMGTDPRHVRWSLRGVVAQGVSLFS